MKAAPLNQAQLADEIIEKLKRAPGALLPILHDLQKSLGFIPDLLIPRIAEALNQTPAEVQGVISFYHEFRTSHPGQHVIQICRAEACQARGSRAWSRMPWSPWGLAIMPSRPTAPSSSSPSIVWVTVPVAHPYALTMNFLVLSIAPVLMS